MMNKSITGGYYKSVNNGAGKKKVCKRTGMSCARQHIFLSIL